jgi:PAS domain S-box-containing protein
MRSVLDHAHEAFVAMDAGGLVIDWNPQAQRTFGWSAEEAVGRVLADLIIPQRPRRARCGPAPVSGRRCDRDAQPAP